MNNLIFFDDDGWKALLPISYTRPLAEIRIGILTIKEKWEKHLNGSGSYITQDYLSEKYPIKIGSDNLVINARLLPNKKIVRLISQLDNNEAFIYQDIMIAARLNETQFNKLVEEDSVEELMGVDLSNEQDLVNLMQKPSDIFVNNKEQLALDFALLTKDKTSAAISPTNRIVNPENIFLEEGVEVENAILNANDGPIYIGKHAKILDGCMVRGGLAMCEHSVLKMGAKIYGPTTVGPYSKIGGEVNNTVFLGYSNKAHDGYIGNSVIGEWCNLGADTNVSNLKNNYAEVKLWDYELEKFSQTGLQFCGLIMGDHSKCGINTMFNTGTVVGVNCNIFGSGYPRNFIPSFSWGGTAGYTSFKLEKAMDVDQKVMARRSIELTELDKKILEHVFRSSAQYRSWES